MQKPKDNIVEKIYLEMFSDVEKKTLSDYKKEVNMSINSLLVHV